jgi:hypothetical protein
VQCVDLTLCDPLKVVSQVLHYPGLKLTTVFIRWHITLFFIVLRVVIQRVGVRLIKKACEKRRTSGLRVLLSLLI